MSAVVESVTTTVIDLPLRRRHKFSVTEIDHQSLVLVRVRTADGAEGIGEAVAPGGPWWGGESVETMQAIIDSYLAPLVMGRDVADVQTLRASMDQQVNENRFAKAGIETALYDAWGRTVGVPVHALLGGLVRYSIPVTWALGATGADEISAEATAKLEASEHASFKLKMGSTDPATDVSRIEKVAAALATRASLRVDLNAAWDELTATRYLPRLQNAGIELVEQPLAAWDIDGMAKLAKRLDMPVMADESVRSEHDAFRVAQARAADVISLKVTKSGGFTVTARIAAIAAACGIPCHGGTSIESSIGTVAALHSYCTLPAVTFGSELFGPLLTADDLLTEPLDYRDGHLHVPAGPGLGVTLDEDKVRHFTRA